MGRYLLMGWQTIIAVEVAALFGSLLEIWQAVGTLMRMGLVVKTTQIRVVVLVVESRCIMPSLKATLSIAYPQKARKMLDKQEPYIPINANWQCWFRIQALAILVM